MSINIDNVGFQYKGNDNLTTSYEWELKNCQDEYNQEKEYIDKEREELFKRRKEFEKKQKKVYWLFIIISIVILPYYNEVKAFLIFFFLFFCYWLWFTDKYTMFDKKRDNLNFNLQYAKNKLLSEKIDLLIRGDKRTNSKIDFLDYKFQFNKHFNTYYVPCLKTLEESEEIKEVLKEIDELRRTGFYIPLGSNLESVLKDVIEDDFIEYWNNEREYPRYPREICQEVLLKYKNNLNEWKNTQ